MPNPDGMSREELSLALLRQKNQERQAVWCPDPSNQPDLSFRGNELGGETGEAQNVIKKLERERHGWKGSRDTIEHLGEELADVVIVADLIAAQAGINLSKAVVEKFNAKSREVGIEVYIDAITLPSLEGKEKRCSWRWHESTQTFSPDCKGEATFGTMLRNQFTYCPFCSGKITEDSK